MSDDPLADLDRALKPYRGTLPTHARLPTEGVPREQVLAANPTRGTVEVPESALVLLDELTLWGDAEQAAQGLDRWYAAGAPS